MKDKGKSLVFVLLSAALFVSCGKGDDKKPTPQPPVKVETTVAASTDIVGSHAYSGTIEESSGTVLSFPVSGTLKTVTVGEGDRVAKGQLIAALDQGTLRNSYEMAKAALDEAQDAYNRMKQLHDSNSLPDMQWVEVQNTLKQAQSAEAIAARALKDANLYAPVSGYVSEKFMEPGMTVAPVAPVVKIVQIDPVKISVSMPENEITGVTEGQKATVVVKAVGGSTYQGTVTEKGVAADPLTRAYDVKIRVANPGGTLLPGMICDVTLEGVTPRQAIVLPLSAVLLDADNQNFVWLSVNGHASKRIVKADGITDAGIVISSGITAGDSIIVAGQQKVSEGTPVINAQ